MCTAYAAPLQSEHKVSSRMLSKTTGLCASTVLDRYSFASSSIPRDRLHTTEQQPKQVDTALLCTVNPLEGQWVGEHSSHWNVLLLQACLSDQFSYSELLSIA
jgi:hypothetical protein